MQNEVKIERLGRAHDHRGYVFEPLDAQGLRAQRNVHVVLTHPGQIRGNHFHETGTEVSTVSGPARVRIKQGETLIPMRYRTGRPGASRFHHASPMPSRTPAQHP